MLANCVQVKKSCVAKYNYGVVMHGMNVKLRKPLTEEAVPVEEEEGEVPAGEETPESAAAAGNSEETRDETPPTEETTPPTTDEGEEGDEKEAENDSETTPGSVLAGMVYSEVTYLWQQTFCERKLVHDVGLELVQTITNISISLKFVFPIEFVSHHGHGRTFHNSHAFRLRTAALRVKAPYHVVYAQKVCNGKVLMGKSECV